MAIAKPDGSGNRKAKVLLVDDHPIVRQGLAQVISLDRGMEVCGEAANAHEALKRVATLNPDIAVVDISLKEGNGIQLIKDMRLRHPRVPVLVLSMHDESVFAERAPYPVIIVELDEACHARLEADVRKPPAVKGRLGARDASCRIATDIESDVIGWAGMPVRAPATGHEAAPIDGSKLASAAQSAHGRGSWLRRGEKAIT